MRKSIKLVMSTLFFFVVFGAQAQVTPNPCCVVTRAAVVSLRDLVGDSHWRVVACQPNESLTLYYGAYGNVVTQVLRVKGSVTYDIAKDDGAFGNGKSLPNTITLIQLQNCVGTFKIE